MELPRVKVDNFEGPFDLLLHLIKKNKMDIHNVEIYKITNQYLKYLNEMKEMDLEITSEFIVIAATLIEIKSRNLLPKHKEEEEDEEDLEKKLLEKLVLYKKIKGSTEFFRGKYVQAGQVYSKKPEIIEEIKSHKNNEEILKGITLIDLYNMLNDMLEIYRNKQNNANIIQKRIYIDKYKIEDKVDYLVEKIKSGKINEFSKILEECECKLESVVTFLALLEMIKQRMVKVYQSSSFGEILLERLVEDE